MQPLFIPPTPLPKGGGGWKESPLAKGEVVERKVPLASMSTNLKLPLASMSANLKLPLASMSTNLKPPFKRGVGGMQPLFIPPQSPLGKGGGGWKKSPLAKGEVVERKVPLASMSTNLKPPFKRGVGGMQPLFIPPQSPLGKGGGGWKESPLAKGEVVGKKVPLASMSTNLKPPFKRGVGGMQPLFIPPQSPLGRGRWLERKSPC